jgi:hypothetical protein
MAIEKIARHAGHASETVYRQELRPDLHDGEVMDRFFGGVNSDQGYQLAVPDAELRQLRQQLGCGESAVVSSRSYLAAVARLIAATQSSAAWVWLGRVTAGAGVDAQSGLKCRVDGSVHSRPSRRRGCSRS